MTPWTITRQAPLSMELSGHEYWSGLPFPSPGDLLSSGIKPRAPSLSGRFFFTTEPPGMPKRQWNFAYLWLTIPPKPGTLQGLGLCLPWFVSPGPNIVLSVCVGSQSISFPQMALLQIRGHWLDLKHFHRSAILSLKFESTSPTITQQSDSLTTQSTAAQQ